MPAELSAARGRSSAGEGQLGDGTNTDRNAPTLIDAGTSYVRIAAFSSHTCGIVSGTGALKCWGYNNDGELGDNTISRRDSPVLIDSSTSYSAVSVGNYHSCGITSANLLKCWGSNNSGQLGSGTQSSYSTPTNVSIGVSLSKLELANEFTCGMDNEGAVFCWGMNASGQLGDGSLLDRSFPTRVDPTRRYSQLSARGSHACGIIKTTGALQCWGRNNSGQLGDGTTSNRSAPTSIDPGTSYAQISTGPSHTCGIVKGTGALKCWGDNTYGQLGDNTTTSRNLPTWIDPGTSYSAVATASEHTCGIVSDTGALKCWGRNNKGQLGDSTTTNRSTPATIDAGTSYSQISAQGSHTCGLISGSGALKCWGDNIYGQLGDGTLTARNVPTLIDAGTAYAQVSSGSSHTCGIVSGTGALKCWGLNNSGSLGDGTTTNRSTPTLIDGGASYAQVSISQSHACGILSGTGDLKCWESNTIGQLGMIIPRTTTPTYIPLK